MPGSWFLATDPHPAPAFRLFCYPFAGGTARTFASWSRRLGPDVEVVALQPPGREARFREPAFEELEPLLADLIPVLAPRLDVSFGVYGHSLGSLVAFELARALRRAALPMPAALWLSGRRPVHLPRRLPHPADLSDAELIEALTNSGSAIAGQSEELIRLVLPIVRRDLAILKSYRYVEEPPLSCPITALAGVADLEVTRDELERWSVHTTGPTRCRRFPGGHFYFLDDPDGLLAALAEEIASLSARSR